MSWLPKIFSQSARKNYFPPKPADQPPQPEGYWSIIVDENGDRVTSRPATVTDFLARPPVAYVDGGTEPAFQKDPRRSEADNVQADPPPINESRNSCGNAIHNGLIKGGAGYGT